MREFVNCQPESLTYHCRATALWAQLPILLALAVLWATAARAQDDRTPPTTATEREAAYTAVIEKRTADILARLGLTDLTKATNVHDVIVAQYRALRARDEDIGAELRAQSTNAAASPRLDRAALFALKSKPLHEAFLTKLSQHLTPAQVEQVKDQMTYNKVKVTFDAYNVIVPGLTEQDKATILDLLKQAREEAIDGGSATEKSEFFQKYKDRINEYLNAHGHDVAKAYRDWNAKQEAAAAAKTASGSSSTPTVQ